MRLQLLPKAVDSYRGGLSVTHQSLDAQRALLPYALAAFAISLPIYVWAASLAPNAVWMTGAFTIFAIAWWMFYAVVSWLKEPAAQDIPRRARVQMMAGLLWSGAVAEIALFADGAGPLREPLLMMSVGAAVVCIFFTAPWLPSLAVVGVTAAAGPLILMAVRPEGRELAGFAAGAITLAFALALILNRTLRRQFALAADREGLLAEQERAAAEFQRLAQSKSDLVATLSHEIRNGLAGVAHVLAGAAGRSRQAPSREQLSAALDATNDLIAVLNTTLDAETAESGRLSVEVRPFDPVSLVRDLVLLNRPTAQAKGLEFTLYVAPELAAARAGAAMADPMRARQILANVIGNALKFTVRGRVEARVERTADGRLAIEIADTGPGLDEAELAQAFEAFHRVERTAAGLPGAGLGLSLSRQLARLMGGELAAHSAVGVGSCFRLELPFDPHAQAQGEPPLAEAPAPAAPSEQRALRILIAEDDGLNAAMLRAILEQLGHQVVHAVDGRRAVELARACDFDLMMIDGRMPNLDGPATMTALRALPGPVGLAPIIAVIGGDADEAAECAAAGADTVLRKPVSLSAVARAVADSGAAERPAGVRHVA